MTNNSFQQLSPLGWNNSPSSSRTQKLKAVERIMKMFPNESVASFDVGNLPTSQPSPGMDLSHRYSPRIISFLASATALPCGEHTGNRTYWKISGEFSNVCLIP
jgi:hypothetical protein